MVMLVLECSRIKNGGTDGVNMLYNAILYSGINSKMNTYALSFLTN